MGFTTLKSYGSQFSITKKITQTTAAATPIAPATQTAYQKLLVDKKPWGRYGAESWNQNTNTLPELGGTSSRDATTLGVMTCMTSGNGSTANIACIGGSKASTITWIPGSIVPNITICSITRYTDSNGNIIIGDKLQGSFIHGHYLKFRGISYIQQFNTPQSSVGNLTDWLIMCSTINPIAIPNNVLIDGVASGTRSGGTIPANQLAINSPSVSAQSAFEFSQLLIFDVVLTAAEMVIVSDAFKNYLQTGVLDSPPYLSPYQQLLKNKKPWGRYSADSINGTTLLELGGNTSRDAVISGLTSGSAAGNGATSPIAYLDGIKSSSSSITWIPGSLMTGLTMCSITRYTDSVGSIILSDRSQGSFIHGHYNQQRGIVGISQYNATVATKGVLTDWLVLLSTMNTSVPTPSNVLIDGVESGTRNGGSIGTSNQLAINSSGLGAYAAFQFSQLLIFDIVLTTSEMVIILDALRNYLRTGVLDSP